MIMLFVFKLLFLLPLQLLLLPKTTTTMMMMNDSIETKIDNRLSQIPITEIENGKIRGVIEEVDLPAAGGRRIVWLYQGIKYGESKRFRKPTPIEPWHGIYNATIYRYACPQPDMPISEQDFEPEAAAAGHRSPSANISQTAYSNEDCLYLNVFQPISRNRKQSIARKPLPVMVWIHGGTFLRGTIFSRQFDAKYIAAIGDVVIVTVAYRLGAFGFLTDPANRSDRPANYGLYDQILALQWVRDNIASFNGDPRRVTIFGESAGSMSIGSLLIAPQAKGLFHRAIMQSGAPNSFIGSENRDDGIGKTRKIAFKLGCWFVGGENLVDCIERKSAESVQAAVNVMSRFLSYFKPTFETDLLQISAKLALKNGSVENRNVDLMFGLVRNEGAPGVYQSFPSIRPDAGISVTAYHAAIDIYLMTQVFGLRNSFDVVRYYLHRIGDLKNPNDIRNSIANVYGDFNIVCPTLFFAEQYARIAAPQNRYYAYRLTQPLANGTEECEPWMGACHAMDVDYVFGSTPPLSERTNSDRELTIRIIRYWTSFAANGDPEYENRKSKSNETNENDETRWTEAFEKSMAGNDSTEHAHLDALRMLQLDNSNYTMITGYYHQVCDQFWRQRIF